MQTSGTLNAVGDVVAQTTAGETALSISVSGGHAGLVVSFGIADDGVTFCPCAARQVGSGELDSVFVVPSGAGAIWHIPVLAGATVRVKAIALTSGSATVRIYSVLSAVSMAGNDGVRLRDSANLDAFGRLRISNPLTLFDATHQYNTSPLFWETATVGSGAAVAVANESSVNLTVTADSGDSVVRQSRTYVRYQPGKSQVILLTGVLGSGRANTTKRLGYFDANNGVFFAQVGTTLQVVVRSYVTGSAVDSAVAQASWNMDPLDGTGPSGQTLDVTKAQIFAVDLQWLGVGRVRFGFVIDGKLIYCHQVENANRLTTVYMTTANLPVRYEITNTAAAAGEMTLKQICSTVVAEGGFERAGVTYAAHNGIAGVSVTTRRAILSIRPAATFNGIVNRATILPAAYDVLATTQNALVEVVYNGTLGGTPSWASAGSGSVVEYDTAGTTVTGGDVIDARFVVAGSKNSPSPLAQTAFSARLPLTLNIAGTSPIVLSIVATAFTGTSVVNSSLAWKEWY